MPEQFPSKDLLSDLLRKEATACAQHLEEEGLGYSADVVRRCVSELNRLYREHDEDMDRMERAAETIELQTGELEKLRASPEPGALREALQAAADALRNMGCQVDADEAEEALRASRPPAASLLAADQCKGSLDSSGRSMTSARQGVEPRRGVTVVDMKLKLEKKDGIAVVVYSDGPPGWSRPASADEVVLWDRICELQSELAGDKFSMHDVNRQLEAEYHGDPNPMDAKCTCSECNELTMSGSDSRQPLRTDTSPTGASSGIGAIAGPLHCRTPPSARNGEPGRMCDDGHPPLWHWSDECPACAFRDIEDQFEPVQF